MRLYSVSTGMEDASAWFSSKHAALKEARELAEGLGVEVEVERNLITLTGRALALAILNQKGFVSHSEVVATVPPPAVWDRF